MNVKIILTMMKELFLQSHIEESGYVELANDTNTVAFMAGYYKLILRFYPKAGRFLLPSNQALSASCCMGGSKSNLSIEISVHQAHFFPEVFSAVPFEEGSYPVGILSRIATDKRMDFLDSR